MDKKLLDEHLINLKKGDMEAFDSIYHLTKKGVFSLVLGFVKNRHTAEDVMHDTYLKIKEKILYYKDGTNGYAWILTIARNLSLNVLEKQNRLDVVDIEENEQLITEEDTNFKKDDTPVFKVAKKVLKESELQVVLMHAVSGYKHREIAKMLNKPLGSILWTYNNAIKKLNKQLIKEGVNEA